MAKQKAQTKKAKQSNSFVANFSIIVFAIVLIAIGIIQFKNTSTPKSYIKTTGVVTSNTSKYNVSTAGGETSYYPVVSFKVAGKTYSFTSGLGNQNSPTYSVGSSVSVAYNPASPASSPKVLSSGAKNNTKIAIGFVIAGALVLLFAVVSIIR